MKHLKELFGSKQHNGKSKLYAQEDGYIGSPQQQGLIPTAQEPPVVPAAQPAMPASMHSTAPMSAQDANNSQPIPAPTTVPAASDSSVIAVAEHCPIGLQKEHWSLHDFDIRAKMYSGHISSVYRAVCKRSGITVALKLYKRSMLNDMERHQIAREIWLHIQLNHSSIIALYAAWKDRDYIYLVLEWAPQGNVFNFAQAKGGVLPEHIVVPMIMQPTISALCYIHELGMIHRDIKPENILMTTIYQIKLADFGLSIHSGYEVANTRLGTIDYLSPEILDCPVKAHPNEYKQNPEKYYTNKVDCWSVGVLAYELLTGRTPFEAKTPPETLLKIKTQEVQYPPGLSPGAMDFMSRALVRDPSRRASMQDLLQHPWVQSFMRAHTVHMRNRTATHGDVQVGAARPYDYSGLQRVQSHGNMSLPFDEQHTANHNSCPHIPHDQVQAAPQKLDGGGMWMHAGSCFPAQQQLYSSGQLERDAAALARLGLQ